MNSKQPSELARILVDGYRSLKNVDLALGRANVLIGANGSGKSNLLSLLRLIPLIAAQSLQRTVGEAGGASAVLHYGPKTTPEMTVRLEINPINQAHDSERFAYVARLGYAAGDSLRFLDESVEYPASAGGKSILALGAGHVESKLDEQAQSGRHTPAWEVNRWLSRMQFYHFHDTSLASPLRQNARQAEDRSLRSDGGNLAAFLRRLATSNDPGDLAAWRRIGGLVRQVAPYVKRLDPALVDQAKPATSAVRLYWFDDRGHRFDAHDFSDGTLRAIALIAALAQPPSTLPAFVSIDEPELGLHPAAVALLAGLVRSVAPRCQVMLATQSPALLDEFTADEVIVAERKDGATQFRRLSAKELESWLEDYSLSELFDKNVLGGRP
jgi:predicted ATPase